MSPGLLALRGFLGTELALDARAFAGVSEEAVIDTVLQCKDEADLHARLQRLRRP